jgi:hypothetical protein
MKTIFAAVALAAALVQPAAAITFPSLTTIYVIPGVSDDGAGDNTGRATTIVCTNVSGTTASVRYQVLHSNGVAAAAPVTVSLPHGSSITKSTHATAFSETLPFLAPGAAVEQGVVNVESTQSGVFCTAMMVDAGNVEEGSTCTWSASIRIRERWSRALVQARRLARRAFSCASPGE